MSSEGHSVLSATFLKVASTDFFSFLRAKSVPGTACLSAPTEAKL